MGVFVEYVKDVAASGKATLGRANIIKQTGDTGFITGREKRRISSADYLSQTAFLEEQDKRIKSDRWQLNLLFNWSGQTVS